MTVNEKDIAALLAAPFKPGDVKLKPKLPKGAANRCLALSYVDARVVQDRLDEVVGIDGWQDEYHAAARRLRAMHSSSVKIGDEWIVKTDVGSPSEQSDGGDRLKAAYSDALKRAAVKFGIGRVSVRHPRPVGGVRRRQEADRAAGGQ